MLEQRECVHCGCAGKLVAYEDVFYARCSVCNKWNKYQFVGLTQKSAIEQWNAANKPTLSKCPHRHSKYAYALDGKEYDSIAKIGAFIGVSPSYIRDRFHQYKVKEGIITIQGHEIARWPK